MSEVTGRIVTWIKRDRRAFGYADVPGVDGDVLVNASVVARRAALRRGDLVRLEVGHDSVGRPIAVKASFLHR